MVSLCVVFLLLMTALVIDIGYAKQYRREAQGSADAAALAAAQDLGLDNWSVVAPATAKRYAGANDPYLSDSSWRSCADSERLAYIPSGTGTGTCVSFDSGLTPTTVRVRLPNHDTPAFFGGIAGSNGYGVYAAATARRTGAAGNNGPCGLCVIGNGTLQIANITQLQVIGGEVWTESLTANSNGSPSVVAPLPIKWHNGSYQQNQVNGCTAPNKPNSTSNWGMNDGAASYCSRYRRIDTAVTNPFESLTVDYTGIVANTAGLNINSCDDARTKFQPDRVYVQNVNIPSGCTVTLAPGRNYYVAGQLNVAAGATLNGTSSTLIFGCAASGVGAACNGEGGKFDFEGTVTIAAPTSGPYARVAILFDPGNTSGTPNAFNGTVTLGGAVYARRSGLYVNGGVLRSWTIVTGAAYFNLLGGTTIIDNSKMAGTTSVTGTIELIH